MSVQHQQQAAADMPLELEPAHVMKIDKHKAREHYERMLRELQGEQQK